MNPDWTHFTALHIVNRGCDIILCWIIWTNVSSHIAFGDVILDISKRCTILLIHRFNLKGHFFPISYSKIFSVKVLKQYSFIAMIYIEILNHDSTVHFTPKDLYGFIFKKWYLNNWLKRVINFCETLWNRIGNDLFMTETLVQLEYYRPLCAWDVTPLKCTGS